MIAHIRSIMLTINEIKKTVPKPPPLIEQIILRPKETWMSLPMPWFCWPPTKPNSIFYSFIKLLLSPILPALCCLVALGFIGLAFTGYWSAYLFMAIDIIVVPILLMMWIAGAIDIPYEFRINRLAVRIRSFIVGSFPSIKAHFIVYVIICLGVIILSVITTGSAVYIIIITKMDIGYATCFIIFVSTVLISMVTIFISFTKEVINFIGSYRPLNQLIEEEPNLPCELSSVKHVIAHWSDLHLTSGKDMPRIEDGRPGGNEVLENLITKHNQNLIDKVDTIVITGDITDTGDAEEWRQFFDLMGDQLIKKTIIVPGNHDVNIPKTASYSLDDNSWNILVLRCALAINHVQGERASIIDNNGHIYSLRTYMNGISRDISDYLALVNKGYRNDSEGERWTEIVNTPEVIWTNIFPMAVTLPNSSLIVIVLNTNDRSSNVVTNAFGNIGQKQMEGLRMIRKYYEKQPQVIALHHHISDNVQFNTLDTGNLARIKQKGMAVHDAGALVSELYNCPAIVLNGHRHIDYIARATERSHLISAASTTLGDESAQQIESKTTGFRSFGIGWDETNVPVILTTKFHQLS